MTAARWCPLHRLVLEECHDGRLICPGGHDWYSEKQQHLGPEYWIVDMEFPETHERFCIWIIREGAPIEGEYYRDESVEIEVTGRAEYLSRPNHWARHGRRKKSDMSFFERAFRGRI